MRDGFNRFVWWCFLLIFCGGLGKVVVAEGPIEQKEQIEQKEEEDEVSPETTAPIVMQRPEWDESMDEVEDEVPVLPTDAALMANTDGDDPKNEQYLNYRGQNRSFIPWGQLDPDVWMELSLWKKELQFKEANPNWHRELRDILNAELMGRVIKCVGICQKFQGKGFSNLQERSSIMEGDELQTEEESYLWVFLLDGTLVRLAPKTSISFREFNIGRDSTLLYARVNYGHVVWNARDPRAFLPEDKIDTDVLFDELLIDKKKPQHNGTSLRPDRELAPMDEALTSLIEEDNPQKKIINRLNRLIKKNNRFLQKKSSYHFLVMGNGSVYGRSLHVELFTLTGGKSYIHSYDPNLRYGESQEEVERFVEFYYRGYINKQNFPLEDGQWYQVDERGRNIEAFPEGQKIFAKIQFLTKRIYHLFLARELFFKSYSRPMFGQNLTAVQMAQLFGYRLWGYMEPHQLSAEDRAKRTVAGKAGKDGKAEKESVENDVGDLNRHVAFLHEYTRRVETTNLNSGMKLRKDLQKDLQKDVEKNLQKEEQAGIDQLDPLFYLRAWRSYFYKLANYRVESP